MAHMFSCPYRAWKILQVVKYLCVLFVKSSNKVYKYYLVIVIAISGLCSSSAQVPEMTNFSLQATGKTKLLPTALLLGTLNFIVGPRLGSGPLLSIVILRQLKFLGHILCMEKDEPAIHVHLCTVWAPHTPPPPPMGEDPQRDKGSPFPTKSRNRLTPTSTSQRMTSCILPKTELVGDALQLTA